MTHLDPNIIARSNCFALKWRAPNRWWWWWHKDLSKSNPNQATNFSFPISVDCRPFSAANWICCLPYNATVQIGLFNTCFLPLSAGGKQLTINGLTRILKIIWRDHYRMVIIYFCYQTAPPAVSPIVGVRGICNNNLLFPLLFLYGAFFFRSSPHTAGPRLVREILPLLLLDWWFFTYHYSFHSAPALRNAHNRVPSIVGMWLCIVFGAIGETGCCRDLKYEK